MALAQTNPHLLGAKWQWHAKPVSYGGTALSHFSYFMPALFDKVAANTSVKVPHMLPEAVISLTLYFHSPYCCKHWLSRSVTQIVGDCSMYIVWSASRPHSILHNTNTFWSMLLLKKSPWDCIQWAQWSVKCTVWILTSASSNSARMMVIH